MKKLTTLKGAKKLSKNEQKGISGGYWNGYSRCTGQGSWCCVTFPSGHEFCDAGRCQPNGACLWF